MAGIAGKHLVDPITADDVPKVDNAIAVGEDLGFQERWWTFERIAWSFFLLVLLADVLGLLGGGWLAKAKQQVPGSGMLMKYDRIERALTPSQVTLQFGPDAAQDGAVTLFVRGNLIKDLGADRVIPQPGKSAVGNDGVTYTFPTTDDQSEVSFELQPTAPGVHWLYMQVKGKVPVSARVFVLP